MVAPLLPVSATPPPSRSPAPGPGLVLVVSVPRPWLSLQADFRIYYEFVALTLNRWDLRRFLSAGLNPAILDMRQRYRVSSRGNGGEAG